MAENSKIEWTDATWNPITGCSVVSPGCTNCYAMRLSGTRMKHHWSRKGLTTDSKAGPVWNGKLRFNREWMHQPIDWKRPRRVFVCAHSDLFHESVPDEWILDVFTVMAIADQHTFQVLTKRADRMRDILSRQDLLDDIYANWSTYSGSAREVYSWPLHNVWLGVSAEDQTRADKRIPDLLASPAKVRFLSCEPLLGPIDLTKLWPTNNDCINALAGTFWHSGCGSINSVTVNNSSQHLNLVICGGESGKGARVWPGFYDAARSLRDQCRTAGVSFFMKQTQGVTKRTMPPIPDDLMIREFTR